MLEISLSAEIKKYHSVSDNVHLGVIIIKCRFFFCVTLYTEYDLIVDMKYYQTFVRISS